MTKAYKFDPHTHTSETSGCSSLSAVRLVEGYHAAGFGGIAITDHLHRYFSSRHDDWDTCVTNFLRGYKAAKAHGDKLGLDVILGAEMRFDTGGYSDYLVYGLDEGFLRQNPYLYKLGLRKLFKRYGDELLIIQAHPYRENDSVDINHVHGVEVYNGNPRHNNRNRKTRKLCGAHPNLYPTSASDAHETEDIGSGWMEFDQPIVDSRRFKELVMRREYVLGRRHETKYAKQPRF